MSKIKNLFLSSFYELKNVRCIAITALFIALHVALDLMNIRIWLTPDLRMSLSFVLSASIGMLFGPVVAMMAGFSTDILGYLANPVGGGFFFGYTLTAIVGGFLYGLFLYPRRPTKLRLLGAKTAINLFCNIGLNTLWLSMMGGKAMHVLLPARAMKNIILLPVEMILLYFITHLVLRVYNRTSSPALSAQSKN